MKKNHIKVIAFVRSLADVAIEINGGSLSDAKMVRIIGTFNIKDGSVFERAKFAIEKVTGKKIPSNHKLEKTASLSNLKTLLNKMEFAANEWQTPKK